MSGGAPSGGGGGCVGCLLAVMVIALVVAGVISLAAIVDPFSLMPPVGEVWADCEDDWKTDRDECALANRFPGFWFHVVVNLAYTAVAVGAFVVFVGAVSRLRDARAARFRDAVAAEDHREAVGLFFGTGVLLAGLALVPIAVAAW